jgi:hypothetical protein
MGQTSSSSKADPPRTQWIYLAANMHEFRLVIDSASKTVSIIEWNGWGPGGTVTEKVLSTLSLDKFVKLTDDGASADASFFAAMVNAHLETFQEEAKASAMLLLN